MFNNVCLFLFLQHVSLFGVSFGDVCSRPASAMKVIFRSLLQMPLVAAVTVPKQTNINYVITTREAQDMIISKPFWLDVWNTKRNTHTSYSIMSVWSWRSSNCSHQEWEVWTKRLWNNKKHRNEFRPFLICFQPQSLEVKAALKRQRFPKNGQIALLPKGHVFSLCDFLGSFSFFTLSYHFTIVIACHCHIHSDKMIS